MLVSEECVEKSKTMYLLDKIGGVSGITFEVTTISIIDTKKLILMI